MGDLDLVLSKGNRIGDTKYNMYCSIDLRIVDLGNAFTKSLKNGMIIPKHAHPTCTSQWRLNRNTKKKGTFGSNHLGNNPTWESTPNCDPCPKATPIKFLFEMNMV